MMQDDNGKTEVRRPRMERTERGDDGDAQRAKFIFLSLAGAVAVLLIWSFLYASKTRSERNTLQQEIEACRQDNIKLTQYLDEQGKEIDALKKKLGSKPKGKAAKTSAKKKTSSKKKTSRSSKSR